MYDHPNDITIGIDNDTTSVGFTCMANGASSYIWKREAGSIPVGSKIDSNRLTLYNILPSDSGRYRCIAKNDHGTTASEYAMLTIEGSSL